MIGLQPAMLRGAVIIAAYAAILMAAPNTPAVEPDDTARLLRGWKALRAMDCARCHGRAYEGWAAPSLIASVREGTRERFESTVLDGEIARGMPAYRGVPVVVDDLDAIYAYLVARAKGEIGPGDPNVDARREGAAR